MINNVLHHVNQVPMIRMFTEGCLLGKKTFELTHLLYQYTQAEEGKTSEITDAMKQKGKELFLSATKAAIAAAVIFSEFSLLVASSIFITVSIILSPPIAVIATIGVIGAIGGLEVFHRLAMSALDKAAEKKIYQKADFKGFKPNKEEWENIAKLGLHAAN